jgi:hypothetical protein
VLARCCLPYGNFAASFGLASAAQFFRDPRDLPALADPGIIDQLESYFSLAATALRRFHP